MADQLFQKRKKQNTAEKRRSREIAPFRYLIICEGEKTEPNYFEAFRASINEKFYGNTRLDRVVIKGIGRNTESLVVFTEKIVKEADVHFGNIWCVFDKDSFSDEQFNSAIELCKNKGYKAAWSNECIELWFLLHFEYLNAAIGREDYQAKLTEYFTKYSLNKGKYEKNLNDIYDLVNKFGNETLAIRYAKKLNKLYDEYTTPSNMYPATQVFKLVEELNSYISDD